MPLFRFSEFAHQIFDETAGLCQPPFMLPALYGGESEDPFKALFVLEAPSVSFTTDRWRQCTDSTEAVSVHRDIFFDWATQRNPGHFFLAVDRIIRGKDAVPFSASDFFHHYYVTDIWKDAHRCVPSESKREYETYWLSKLAVELNNVRTQRVIFVGRDAERGRALVPLETPSHYLPFPSWSFNEAKSAAAASVLEMEIAEDSRRTQLPRG